MAFSFSVNDELALHVSVPDAAMDAALESVGSRCACHELHGLRGILFEPDALPLRGEHQAGISLVFSALRILINFETVQPISGGDL